MAGVCFPMKNTMTINGRVFTLAPYTEKRRHALDKIRDDVRAYIDENPSVEWHDIEDSIKESFWLRKAQVLFIEQMDEHDIANEYFEYELLANAESFFLIRQGSPSTLPKNTLGIRTTYRHRSYRVGAKECGFVASGRTDTTHLSLRASTPYRQTRYGICPPTK